MPAQNWTLHVIVYERKERRSKIYAPHYLFGSDEISVIDAYRTVQGFKKVYETQKSIVSISEKDAIAERVNFFLEQMDGAMFNPEFLDGLIKLK